MDPEDETISPPSSMPLGRRGPHRLRELSDADLDLAEQAWHARRQALDAYASAFPVVDGPRGAVINVLENPVARTLLFEAPVIPTGKVGLHGGNVRTSAGRQFRRRNQSILTPRQMRKRSPQRRHVYSDRAKYNQS